MLHRYLQRALRAVAFTLVNFGRAVPAAALRGQLREEYPDTSRSSNVSNIRVQHLHAFDDHLFLASSWGLNDIPLYPTSLLGWPERVTL